MKTFFKVLFNQQLDQDELERVWALSFRHFKLSWFWNEQIAKLEVENLILSKQVDRERAREFFYSLI